MKMQYWIHSIFSAIILLFGVGCTDDTMVTHNTVSDEEVWVTIPFGHKDFEQTTVTTRSTLSEVAESRINDLYLFIFVNKKSVYNHYFGDDSKKSTANDVLNAQNEQCWYVSNRTSETNNTNNSYPNGDNADTHGYIHIRGPEITGGTGTLYLIANANAYTVNISPDKLSTVRTEDDLKELTASLNGDVVTRYGYFPMIGIIDNISLNKDGIKYTPPTTNSTATDVKIPLERIDAKIEVHVQAATGHYYTHEGSRQTVNAFIPETWRVVNVPKGAFLLENATAYDGIAGYFSTSPVGFETTEASIYTNADNVENSTTKHGFSFYMLENRYVSEGDSAITDHDFNKRDQRNKNDNGTNATSGNVWTYAPDESTYIEIKGFLSMQVEEDELENGTQELGANVTYYIHLGDFNDPTYGLNNYKVERNKHYIYNITIKGVENIQVEVESNDEKQPGAEGDIFISQQTSMLLDAHYSQFVSSVHVDNLNANTMAWYTKTPFGRNGSPKLNGINPDTSPTEYADALKGYDYKWIWFMINPSADFNSATSSSDTYSIPEEDEAYSTKNQWYPGNDLRDAALGTPRKLMNVEEFVTYIKEQKTNHSLGKPNIFRNGEIYFTIFIDEYYYEKHPIEGEDSPKDLWKQFVNQPNRLMHILCGSNISIDGESSATNSVITIRQRSIQTPYNTTKDQTRLPTAWGCETMDETADDQLWFYNESDANITNKRNTSIDNGRFNTALLLGMMSRDNDNSTPSFGDKQWKTFINYEQGNLDEPNHIALYLNNGYKGMLYATLLRNRDNDGDSYIDADELRWYVGSLGQLNGIYIGEQGFTSMDTHLYPRELSSIGATETIESGNFQGYRKWRRHVVSSTRHSSSEIKPTIIWAEEGISTNHYRAEQGWGKAELWAPLSIRCLRNLGMDYTDETEAKEKIIQETEIPEPLIKVSTESTSITSNTVYYFDLTNVNEASLRPTPSYTELEVTDEFNFLSRPYKGFITGGLRTLEGTAPIDEIGNRNYYLHLTQNYLNLGISPCATGYRVPNVREGALMRLYCTNSNWWTGSFMVTTYYSNGHTESGGNGNDPKGGDDDKGYKEKNTWWFNHNESTVEASANRIREVKDWTPDE